MKELSLKTKDGHKIRPYMLLMNPEGCSSYGSDCAITYHIYFLKQIVEFDGRGYDYTRNGEDHSFYYCSPSSSLFIKKPPLHFLSAFKSGMYRINVKCTEDEFYKGFVDGSYFHILQNSNWKEFLK